MNFLHVTDLHLVPLNRRPRARNVKFHDQIADKFVELKKIINKENVEAVFISGDIFHLKNSNLYTPENINYYSNLFEGLEVPFFSIPGNHDFPKSSIDEWDKTAYLNLVKSTKNLFDMSEEEASFKLKDSNVNINLFGIPFHPLENMVEELEKMNERVKKFKGLNVLLLHTDILPDPKIFLFWSVMGYDVVLDILENIDIICLGHIHQSFPVYKRKNLKSGKFQFISKPWSFSRVVKDYFNNTEVYEHQHKPSYSLLSFKDTSFEIEYREIPHVGAGEAFDEPALVQGIERSQKIANFMKSLESIDLKGKENLFEMFDPKEVLNSFKIENEVREILYKYLERSGIE